MTSNFIAPAPRSSNRISLQVQVLVHGRYKNETEFREETATLVVNSGGALVPLASDVSLGEAIRIVNKSTQREQECRVAFIGKDRQGRRQAGIAFRSPVSNFWRINRRENRISKRIRVKVRGVDQDGHPFVRSAYSIDISHAGARLDGIGYLTQPGQTIEVRRLWRTARFLVMWVGTIGTPEAGQAGAFSLEAKKDLWGGDLP
jgi:hypothetical protein